VIVDAVKRYLAARADRKALAVLQRDARKGATALDIMLSDYDWYGGAIVVVENNKPQIEVLIVDFFPGKLSAFVPPRMGAIPVLVRLGSMQETLPT
jgi:hypothetical protein